MRRYQILGIAVLLCGAAACNDDDSNIDEQTEDAGSDNGAAGSAAGRGGSSSTAGRGGSGGAAGATAGRGGAGGSAGSTAAGAGGGGTGGSAGAVAGAGGAAGSAAGAGGSTSDEPKNIVETAGLVEALSGAGPFTVFAPTDAAFAAFETANPGVLAGLSAEALGDVLKYHVVSAEVKAADLESGQLAETLQGARVAVTIDGSAVKINDANVTMADVDASNGVIHVIDKVLLPPKDIIDTAIAAGSFTQLAAALTAAGLVDDLKGEGPFTVFAPTDAAFAKLSAAPTGDALETVLKYHVLSGVAGPLDLKDKGVVTTLAGSPALIELTGGAKIAGANITTTNIVASNGVIHVIDTVIVPPENDIVETALAAGSFTSLAAALTAADLVDALQGDGPFTVFAPTDAAFEALGTAPTGDALRNVLQYHVVMGAVGAGDLEAGMVPTLLANEQLTIDLSSGVKVNDATVSMANIVTKNGVIHVVDKVLVPN
jgi:transforming growth factor-beta-induced protein